MTREHDGLRELGLSCRVIRVTIGCPGDVNNDVSDIFGAIHLWNQKHGESEGVFLSPKHWLTHSHPTLGGEAQQIINSQLIDKTDILIAIFRNRLGSPTISASSGTAEEIAEIYKSGRPVKVYFSTEPVSRAEMHNESFGSEERKLHNFLGELFRLGICWPYQSVEGLKNLIFDHIYSEIRELKDNAFVVKARGNRIKKYMRIEEIGAINRENWRVKAREITEFLIIEKCRNMSFRKRIRRSDLVRVYQLVLHELGITLNCVNLDREFDILYRNIIDVDILPEPPDGNYKATYNYHALLSYGNREITRLYMPRERGVKGDDIYYGYSCADDNNQYKHVIEKLSKKGFDVSMFSTLKALIVEGISLTDEIPAHLPSEIRKANHV